MGLCRFKVKKAICVICHCVPEGKYFAGICSVPSLLFKVYNTGVARNVSVRLSYAMCLWCGVLATRKPFCCGSGKDNYTIVCMYCGCSDALGDRLATFVFAAKVVLIRKWAVSGVGSLGG